MFTGAIKLLGTPVEKKWAGPCPVQKYELGSYIQFLTAHCPSPWFVSTEELFQFAAKKLMTSVSSTCNITKKRTFSLTNWLLLEQARIYYITMYLSKMKRTSRYILIYRFYISQNDNTKTPQWSMQQITKLPVLVIRLRLVLKLNCAL